MEKISHKKIKKKKRWEKQRVNLLIGTFYLSISAVVLLTPSFFVFQDIQEINQEDDSAKKQREAEENIAFPQSSVKFTYFTDAHCYGKTVDQSVDIELNWRCQKPLNELTNRLADFGAEFIFDGGDDVDGRDKRAFDDFVAVRNFFEQKSVPFYQTIGNHETRSFEKSDWLAVTGNRRSYYYFDIREYRFIVLDGNFCSRDGEEKDTTPDLEYFPGLINRQQLRWLRRVLAQSKNRTVIAFIHQPPLDGTKIRKPSSFLYNRQELRDIFSQYGVKAVFSGHIEELCSKNIEGVDYYTMTGFWKPNPGYSRRFKDEGFFYQIEITSDKKIKIETFLSPSKEGAYESFWFDKDFLSCDNPGEEQVKRIDQLLSDKIPLEKAVGNKEAGWQGDDEEDFEENMEIEN